jgi:RNA polymerase sigma-70 factor (ECF subfamily)
MMASTAWLSSDADLLPAAIAGDEAAFDALVGPLIEPGYKLAAVMLRDGEEARDAVQDACLMAWKKLFQLRADTRVRPWFLTIVANHCRTLRRRRWWSEIRLASPRQQEEISQENVESDLDLDRELGKLPVTDRAALFLFFYMDLPLADVAKVLKISPQAAKARVHRAVARLRLSMVEVPT